MPRPIRKGTITFGMVSIPVRLLATTRTKDVQFHLLHRLDHARVRNKRWCSLEDREVPNDELVRAYEVSTDQYVEVTDAGLAKIALRNKERLCALRPMQDTLALETLYYPDEINEREEQLVGSVIVTERE